MIIRVFCAINIMMLTNIVILEHNPVLKHLLNHIVCVCENALAFNKFRYLFKSKFHFARFNNKVFHCFCHVVKSLVVINPECSVSAPPYCAQKVFTQEFSYLWASVHSSRSEFNSLVFRNNAITSSEFIAITKLSLLQNLRALGVDKVYKFICWNFSTMKPPKFLLRFW